MGLQYHTSIVLILEHNITYANVLYTQVGKSSMNIHYIAEGCYFSIIYLSSLKV